MHHLCHLLHIFLVICQEIQLIEAVIVEAVDGKRCLTPLDSLLLAACQSQDRTLQATCLVVMGVADEAALNLLLGIVHAMLHHGNLCTREEACILPSGIPC